MPKEIIFTKQQTDKIINMYEENISCKKIGMEFNCSKQTINKIIKQNNIEIKDTSHSNRKYIINENIFENIDNHEKAYWLGMLAGDGCVSVGDKNKNRNEIRLSLQEKDKEHIAKYKKFLKCDYPITMMKNRQKKDGSPSMSYNLGISSKKMVSDLNKYNIKPNKTKNMTFPSLPDEFISSYMLGLIDSDGCFCLKSHYKNKDIKLLNFSFVGPIDFVEKFQNILIDKCGISRTKLDIQKRTPFIRILSYGGFKNIIKIVKYLYSDCPIFLHRKRDLAINYLLTKYPNDDWLNKYKNIMSI